MKKLIGFISIAFVLASCNSNLIYADFNNIQPNGWHKDSVYSYQTDSLTDMPDFMKIGFDVRNTVDYKYRNLYLFVELEIPGQKVIKDTLDHILMSPDGFWLDEVEGSSIKESTKYYKYAIKNPPQGVYTIKVQQGMRDSILKEIVSVGARIEKLEK